MIQHVLFFKLKPETTDEQEQIFLSELQKLQDTCSEWVTKVQVGPNITQGRNKGYTHCAIISIKDQESLKPYSVAKPHVAAISKFKAFIAEVTCLDIAVNSDSLQKS